MTEQSVKIFFLLLGSAVRNKPLSEQERSLFTEDLLPELKAEAKKHDISAILSAAIDRNGLLQDCRAEKIEIAKAVFRYEQLNYTLNELCEALEGAKIPFMPLKGSVLRKYYPEPWMRTSCDIDMLVHEEDVDRAAEYLVSTLGYRFEKKCSHDISLYTADGKHVELHFDLVEEGRANASAEVLKCVWEMSAPKKEGSCHYEMPDGLFYFYHIAHAAKHFEEGGCGIRPFIDLLFLDSLENADTEKRDSLLEKGGLLPFANAARRLSRAWLKGAPADPTVARMSDFVVFGGVYGNLANYIVIEQNKKGSEKKYLLSRIFMPYDKLKKLYPVLEKHRWLTPVMELRRWFTLAFGKRAKSTAAKLKLTVGVTEEKKTETQLLFDELGL